MQNKYEQLKDNLRSIQGQFAPVEIQGKSYVFKKLTRREYQETLYNLVKPLVKSVVTVIKGVGIDIKDLTDADKITKAVFNNVELVSDIFDSIPYERLFELEKKLLRDVVIDNSLMPDDFENPDSDEPGYFDGKLIELFQALIMAIKLNYPMIGGLMNQSKGIKEDSNRQNEQETKTE